MNTGLWHQFGDRSQKIILEQLNNGIGSGVILSPRDLKFHLAKSYSEEYHNFEVDLLIDQQFYLPAYINKRLKTYPISKYRAPITEIENFSESDWDSFSRELENVNSEVNATAILAPALIYEVGRKDIEDINLKLFQNSKRVGDSLGLPTYKTVILGKSLTASQNEVNKLLSNLSNLDLDGWYFSFEFENQDERIPFNKEYILRFLNTILNLRLTEKPVLNSYAGPLSILSLCSGGSGAGVGHFQNTWHFHRSRWKNTSSQGGGGDAPARFFSKYLWGTIIYPDETTRLDAGVRETVLLDSQSPYSEETELGLNWKRWKSNKHLIHVIGEVLKELSSVESLSDRINMVKKHLRYAVKLHSDIDIVLKDETDKYQENWLEALTVFEEKRSDDIVIADLLN